MQLDGFTVVAEYGSRFEADIAAERLTGDGVDTMVQSDPAHQVAPHIVNLPGHRLLVAGASSELAAQLLADYEAALGQQAPRVARGLRGRPRWFRWLAYALVLAFPVAIAVTYAVAFFNLVS